MIKTRVGVVGTGFVATGLVQLIKMQEDLFVAKVLTRRNISEGFKFPDPQRLTNSVSELITSSDVIIECSGDPIYATEVIGNVLEAHIPVITLDCEFHITTGSYFAGREDILTEAEGDQPGCLASLREEAIQMGFKPLVLGNIKGYLNVNPDEESMSKWSRQLGISLEQTVSFTDGTKLQIEQAFVANGLHTDIIQPGLIGHTLSSLDIDTIILAKEAKKLGCPVSDYIISPKGPPGVFITAEHGADHRHYLKYYKMGEGPYYTLVRNYHLCHLEVLKTVRSVMYSGKILLNNSPQPRISVGAIAKKDLEPGHRIKKGIGSFEVRGIAIKLAHNPHHVPIGLLSNATVVKPLKAGQLLSFDDVELSQQVRFAQYLWENIKDGVIEPSGKAVHFN